MAEEKKSAKDLLASQIEKEIPGAGEMPKAETGPAPDAVIESQEGTGEKEDVYTKILAIVKKQTPPADDSSVPQDAAAVRAEETSEARINNLVNLAMQKGVIHAVKVARHLEDNYTLDEMHDRLLADEFHKALVEKGLLKEL
jgi:hypothetical protein